MLSSDRTISDLNIHTDQRPHFKEPIGDDSCRTAEKKIPKKEEEELRMVTTK